jgi:hypothetical protein
MKVNLFFKLNLNLQRVLLTAQAADVNNQTLFPWHHEPSSEHRANVVIPQTGVVYVIPGLGRIGLPKVEIQIVKDRFAALEGVVHEKIEPSVFVICHLFE